MLPKKLKLTLSWKFQPNRNSETLDVRLLVFYSIDWDYYMGDQEPEHFFEVVQDNFLKQMVNNSAGGKNILGSVM